MTTRQAKISETQKSVIKRMWESGSTIHFVSGMDDHYFLSGTLEVIHRKTVSRLLDLKLLFKFHEGWRGWEARLNEKGKELAKTLS